MRATEALDMFPLPQSCGDAGEASRFDAEDIEISPVGGSLFHQSDELVVRGWPGVVVGLQVL